MLIRDKLDLPGLINPVYKSRGSLWIPGQCEVDRKDNIIGLLHRPDGTLFMATHNIVTDAGDVHYAQRAVGEAVTNNFNTHYQASAAAAGHPAKTSTWGNFTVIAGSGKVNDTGYPQRNNADADNPDRGVKVITHKVSYAKADFTAASITHGLISIAAAAAASPLLTGFAWAAAFAKSADDSLVVYVNHAVAGV